MNNRKYKKMDKFVNEMNQSVNIVGDMSIYLFNRFRNFVGYLFVTITTVAIAFIVAEFVRGFEFDSVMGIDVYYIALLSSLIVGLYVAFYGEEAKIATIKGAIFSSGSNRTWQAGAALAIILVLIMVNAKGVQKIADFSLRYMDTELKNSVVFKLKEQKMKSHASLASTRVDFSGQQTLIDNLNVTRQRYLKQRDSVSLKEASVWDWKISRLDKKIALAQDKLYNQIDMANRLKQAQMSETDRATDDLISHYKSESNRNKNSVDMYKDIGFIVAIGGEIIDGLLAFLLFMIVKSNPNVNATPKVQENTRKMVRLKTYENESIPKNHEKKVEVKKVPFELNQKESLRVSIDKNNLDDKLFLKIKKVASVISRDKNEFIKVGMNRYLKHPSQRELIKAFSEYGVTITPFHVSEYFTKMEDEIMFVNQKIGFVYTQIVKKLAA
jgi:hypothetical protein